MSWRQNIIDALAPDRQIDIHDERRFAAEGFVYRPAAVLIALTDRSEPGVILTQRPDWLRSHAGQVAFPGGKIDDTDSDVFAAALREAEEEIALPRDAVTLLGEADTYHSGSGYRISPVLGIIPPDLPLVANPEEVDDWFEVPLDFLVDPKNAKLQTATWQGQTRQYYDMDWQGRRIWGVTAGIIANLARRLRG
ncbi:CoA pyrophosphatase [Sphingorhabdus pulchriflava]|uniref:CoA pyrophosphatase n=1 Tax=Sphingorhabdus pulchriflava TaxID=2292257 RepID=A0A371BHP6_9SPHN|nr:CoA pyrophosphatase [Sphingorhabdus pulchriflava]RDV07058.1 CoA pyrophosphatase [Sphingorhabdus pulchriflava]